MSPPRCPRCTWCTCAAESQLARDDLARNEVHREIAIDDEEPVDRLRIVGNQPFPVAWRIRPPPDHDRPAVLAVACRRLDLHSLDSVRHRYQQVVDRRFDWNRRAEPAQREPGCGERCRRVSQVPQAGVADARRSSARRTLSLDRDGWTRAPAACSRSGPGGRLYEPGVGPCPLSGEVRCVEPEASHVTPHHPNRPGGSHAQPERPHHTAPGRGRRHRFVQLGIGPCAF